MNLPLLLDDGVAPVVCISAGLGVGMRIPNSQSNLYKLLNTYPWLTLHLLHKLSVIDWYWW